MKKGTHKTLRQHALALLSILSLPMALTGCGGGSSTAAASYDRGYYEGEAEVMEAPAYGVDFYAGDYDNGMYDAAAETTAAAAAVPYPQEKAAPVPEGALEDADTGDSSGVTQTAVSDTTLPMDRKLIRNIELRVETTSFDDLLTSIQTKVSQLEGYTEQSDISGNSITQMGRPSKKYASMVLRIPAGKLNTFVSYVEADGNVTYRSENVSDVTLQYSDMESRLKTLRMEQDRLWELLAKADTTEAIILLEERLTEVSSEIETIGSRLRHMDNSVTYSTVYLDITEVDLESPTEPETPWQQIQRGFARNLNDLGTALTAFFIGLLSNSPTYIFLLLFFFAAYRLIRMIIRHKQKKEEAPTEAKKTFFSYRKAREQAARATGPAAGYGQGAGGQATGPAAGYGQGAGGQTAPAADAQEQTGQTVTDDTK